MLKTLGMLLRLVAILRNYRVLVCLQNGIKWLANAQSGENGNCISFHMLYLQPFGIEKMIWGFKVSFNRKKNKQTKSKKIPEKQKQVLLSTVYTITAKEIL